MSDPLLDAAANVPTEPVTELFGPSAELVREVAYALENERTEIVQDIIDPLHPADVADVVEQLPSDLREPLMQVLDPETAGDMLAEVNEGIRDDLLRSMPAEQVAEAVATLDSDDQVYVLEDLSEKRQQAILRELDAPDALSLADSLSYPDDSAGRIMQRDLVAVPAFWTVGQVIDFLRDTDELPDTFYQLFVIDADFKPIGGVLLDRLLRAKRPTRVDDIMMEEPIVIPAETDQEEVGLLFKQYDLVTAAVVDETGRLVGCITVDDMVEIVQDEVEEDVLRLAGVGEEEVSDTVMAITRSRFIWLLVNLGTAILASAVIAIFAETIEQVVALAILMPIVASMGGNAGTQTLTIAVRALATHELTAANAMRIVTREVLVGGLNGILFAVLIGGIAGWWFENPALGGVIALAMVINMIVAGLSGILVPMGLDRLNIDPAVSSSVFVTTVTDVVGFFAFLGLAGLIML